MAANSSLGTATSASWQTIRRASIRPPHLDQLHLKAMQRPALDHLRQAQPARKFTRLQARMKSWSRTWLDTNRWQERRNQFRAYLVQLSQFPQILLSSKDLRLKPAQGVGASCLLLHGPTADYTRIAAKAAPAHAAHSCHTRISCKWVGAAAVNPNVPSSYRQASSPASEVILAPWNSSLSHLSNGSFSASWAFSPIGPLRPALPRKGQPFAINLDMPAFEAILPYQAGLSQFDIGNPG